ncbi:hypothetical protein [Actinacidiphila acidipaludis]|uniref:Uncharacterized protein n=1 Tax=Actinacidiphila acidipaludis TaxID=2873382 RepID=A0ABS7Q733_9ACTN|nr:hypothetical protein [Streptomyces acidipaludis]MBY8878656.1 hypothetical protein [Streptomyces acidipaludis]
MPLTPEEPQIHESVPGPRTAQAAGRSASTPRPVPGPPRPAAPRSSAPRPSAPRPAPPREPAAAGVGSGRSVSGRSAGVTAATPTPATPATPAPEQRAAVTAQSTVPKQREGGSGGTQIQLIPAPADGAIDAADETVDLLLDTGRAPGEILVLTSGERHPWAAHELTFGEESYWAQYDAADDVFYADIAADRAKGRPVVVVAVNGGNDETMPQALAGALERAGALLIVCGDPARINTLLGANA